MNLRVGQARHLAIPPYKSFPEMQKGPQVFSCEPLKKFFQFFPVTVFFCTTPVQVPLLGNESLLSFWHHSQNTSSRDGRLQHKRAARCLVSLNAKKPRHSTVFQGRHLFCMPFIVPLTGIEPVRCCHHGILSPGRLPVPPQRHITNIIIQILQNQEGKAKILPRSRQTCKFFALEAAEASGSGGVLPGMRRAKPGEE